MPVQKATKLLPHQEAALARLKNYGTRYEVAATHADGRRWLIGYTPRKSMRGLFAASANVKMRTILKLIGAPEFASFSRVDGRLAIRVEGGGLIEFTGRTQRDAILDPKGELPWVGDLS